MKGIEGCGRGAVGLTDLYADYPHKAIGRVLQCRQVCLCGNKAILMRLWTLHPSYLDRQGLVALWREALLAQAVLQAKTKGYRRHPQLVRFKEYPDPLRAIATCLLPVLEESRQRGYVFDPAKILCPPAVGTIAATKGQLMHEWRHLPGKLHVRSPRAFDRLNSLAELDPHPFFQIVDGDVEPWEKMQVSLVP